MSVETKAGIKYIELVSIENDYQVKVNMGKAEFLENPAKEYDLHCVSVGNPHAVMIVDDVKNFDVHKYGKAIEFKTKNYLAEANLLTFGLESAKNISEWSKDDIRLAASFLCTFCEKISIEDSVKIIVLSREKSKFPTNILEEDAALYIDEQKEYYEKTLYDLFKKIDSESVVEILTKMVMESTRSGSCRCKWYLLENIIAKYEIDLSDFIEEKRTLILKDIDILTDYIVSQKENNLNEMFYKLEKDLERWKSVVYPIMVIKSSRGLNDENCENLFYAIRKLMLISANDYNNYHFSLRLTKLCKNIFAELRSIQERMEEDDRTLSSLAQKADDEAREKKDFMEFSCVFGSVFKTSVKTDEKAIIINDKEVHKFEDIEKFKWGRTVNNVILDTLNMSIEFVTKNQKVPVKLNLDSEILFERLKEILWRGAGSLILERYLKELKKGKTISIGSTTIYDYGIELKKCAFIFSSIKMFSWKDIKYSLLDDGILEIKGPDNYQIALDVNKEYNVYVLYVLLNMFSKHGNGIRLTSIDE